MSTPTHTPGPWTYDRTSGYIGTNEGVIAKIQSSEGWAGIGGNIIATEQVENGRFIVRACNAHQEMYDALLYARACLGDRSRDGSATDDETEAYHMIEAAVAKAEGR